MDTQPQSQPESQPQESQTPANNGQPQAPKHTVLTILLVAFFIDSFVYLIIFNLIKAIYNPTENTPPILSLILYLLTPIISSAISIFIAYLIVKNRNNVQYNNNPAAAKTANDSAKHALSAIGYTFLFFILLSILFIVLSAAWASDACTKEGGNDCAIGWVWGFFIVPASFILALIISSFLARAVMKRKDAKKLQ